MNKYIARTIFDDVKENVVKFCGCYHGKDCSKIWAASGLAILIPAAFCLQLTALMVDQWAEANNTTCDDNFSCHYDFFGCMNYAGYEEGSCLCALEITCVVILNLIWLFEFVVCCRTCGRGITVESCAVCHVCIISMLSLIPGILSIGCCLLTAKFVSDHKDQQFTFLFSFYVFMVTGCLTLAISIASICGYICVKWLRLRHGYDTQFGSDDADRETAPLLNE